MNELFLFGIEVDAVIVNVELVVSGDLDFVVVVFIVGEDNAVVADIEVDT